jgi:hypothetical protein
MKVKYYSLDNLWLAEGETMGSFFDPPQWTQDDDHFLNYSNTLTIITSMPNPLAKGAIVGLVM